MENQNQSRLAASLVLLVIGIGFAVATAFEAYAVIRVAEPVTVFVIISAAAGIAGLLGGAATMNGWLRSRANRQIALSIMAAFSKQPVILANDLIDLSEDAFYVLKTKGDVRGKFDRGRCEEGIARLRFEGHICADTSGLNLWWHRTYSTHP